MNRRVVNYKLGRTSWMKIRRYSRDHFILSIHTMLHRMNGFPLPLLFPRVENARFENHELSPVCAWIPINFHTAGSFSCSIQFFQPFHEIDPISSIHRHGKKILPFHVHANYNRTELGLIYLTCRNSGGTSGWQPAGIHSNKDRF